MTRPRLACLSALLVVIALGLPRAEACGGCFSPPETITAVESHRMVVSLSTEQTTLWDQIRYSGDPADFVWVLPVPDGSTASVGVADPVFFEELEQQTAPVIQPPAIGGPIDCAPPPPGCGFGGGAAGGQDAAAAGDSGVTIFHEETVGPYETVVIGSEDATALRDWLTSHGYNVPAETQPVLDHYIAAGSDFVVLRLAPEAQVDAMQPVRVRYPGYMATFPLKMVTVGAYGALDMTLWVIADQRYAAANYGTFTIRDDELVWDFATSSSNYQQLFTDKIEANGGRGWIAEHAGQLDWLYFSSAPELEIARAGLVSPFVTRLRTRMLVDHLAQDLELGPAPDASIVDHWHYVTTSLNAPPPPSCPDWSFCDTSGGGGGLWPGYHTGGSGCSAIASPGSCALGYGAALLLLVGGVVWLARRRSTHART